MIGEVAESLMSSIVILERPASASWRGVGAILACGVSGGGGGGGRRREERLGAGRDSLPSCLPSEGTCCGQDWGGVGGIWVWRCRCRCVCECVCLCLCVCASMSVCACIVCSWSCCVAVVTLGRSNLF